MTLKNLKSDESGQGLVEYVLMLSIIVSAFLIVSQGLQKAGVVEKLVRPIRQEFAAAYQFGHPKAKGFDNGGPEKHPRAIGKDSFRIFINPRVR